MYFSSIVNCSSISSILFSINSLIYIPPFLNNLPIKSFNLFIAGEFWDFTWYKDLIRIGIIKYIKLII